MKFPMTRPIAFLVAWLLLVFAVAVTGAQTQQLVTDQNAVLAQQNAALELAQDEVCGSWLGVFRALDAWLSSSDANIPLKKKVRLEQQFVDDYEAHCEGYDPVGS